MVSVEVPDTVKQVLNAVTPYFQNYLRDHFIARSERQQRNRRYTVNFENAVIIDSGINIELSNLNVIEATPCILNNFQVDLEQFNVALEVETKQIILDGDFTTFGDNILVPKSGKIRFELEDVTVGGNVGIYIVGDSFMTKNYDLNLKVGKTDKKVVSGSLESPADIEKGFAKHISVQLLNLFFINEVLLNQLSEPMVDYSAGELLLDEPEEMIFIGSQRISEVNGLLASLFPKKSVLETPSLSIPITIANEHVICDSGKGQLDLSFERRDDFSFYEKDGVQYFYGYIKLKKFLFKYPSFTIRNKPEIKGSIEIGAYRSQIFIKLARRREESGVKTTVEKVEAVRILDITVNPANLEILGEYNHQLKSHIVAGIQGVVFPLLEQRINEEFTKSINAVQM